MISGLSTGKSAPRSGRAARLASLTVGSWRRSNLAPDHLRIVRRELTDGDAPLPVPTLGRSAPARTWRGADARLQRGRDGVRPHLHGRGPQLHPDVVDR